MTQKWDETQSDTQRFATCRKQERLRRGNMPKNYNPKYSRVQAATAPQLVQKQCAIAARFWPSFVALQNCLRFFPGWGWVSVAPLSILRMSSMDTELEELTLIFACGLRA